MITELYSLQQAKEFIEVKDIAVMVFSTRSCNVCKPLITKINRVLHDYETIGFANVYIEEIKEAQGEYQVYTAPIVLLFVDGKEIKRYSAAMDILDFHKTIDRYNGLVN
jgi:thiol-disulfide isomerase/thioredoxin